MFTSFSRTYSNEYKRRTNTRPPSREVLWALDRALGKTPSCKYIRNVGSLLLRALKTNALIPSLS